MNFTADKDNFLKDEDDFSLGGDFEKKSDIYREEITEEDPKMKEIEKEVYKIFNILNEKL